MWSETEVDLAKHAADKISQILADVCGLEVDSAAKARICLMASSVCIGKAGAYLSHSASMRGEALSQSDAHLGVLKLLENIERNGVDATLVAR